MSFLGRIWRLIRNPVGYVGRDLEGNKFFEYPSPLPESRLARRVVQYKNQNDMWDYIGGGKRLPVQWSSWLSHTRLNPPTLEELQADLERQERVRVNAAMIEARDNENRAKMIAEGAASIGEARQSRMDQILHEEQAGPEHTNEVDSPQNREVPSHENESDRSQEQRQDGPRSVDMQDPEETSKPQAWTPRALSRDD